MWSSIEKIHHPNNLQEAFHLYRSPEKIYISGGSYLVSRRSKKVCELISLGNLLGTKIVVGENEIAMESGCTIQEVAKKFSKHILGQAAQNSCFSKNIRNQRTIGGEIAEKNLQSDFYVAMYALQAKLQVMKEQLESIPINHWTNAGIITELVLNAKKMENLKLFRYTILPSAAPFLIIAVVSEETGWNCVVAGKVEKIQEIFIAKEQQNSNTIRSISQQLVQAFSDDQYGSVVYKEHLIGLSLSNLL